MDFPNQTQLFFKGEERQTLWGVENPEFNGTEVNVTLDCCVMAESRVPFRYENGKDIWMDEKGSDAECMTYVFKLGGAFTPEKQDQQMRLIGQFTHELQHDWSQFHTSHRFFEGAEKGSIRTFIYRIHRNVAGQCQGHPEMLCGAPLGMHHCGCCGEMVMAGLPHPSQEHFHEFHEACAQDDRVQQDRERAAWFDKVWKEVETRYGEYVNHEQENLDDLPTPIPESLRLAREFLEYVRKNIEPDSLHLIRASLDHEGYVGLFSPYPENSTVWWSCAFYPEETVTFRYDKAVDDHGHSVKIAQGPNHNSQLLAMIHKL